MADAVVTVSDNISAAIAQKLRDIGVAAKTSYGDVERLKTSLRGVNSAVSAITGATSNVRAFATAANSAGSSAATLTSRNAALASSFGRVGAGARTAAGQIRAVGNASRTAGRSFHSSSLTLRSLAGGFILFQGVRTFIDLADTGQRLDNMLRTIAGSQAEFVSLQTKIAETAVKSRSSLEGTTLVFARFFKALRGAEGAEGVLDMVETLQKAFIIAGKTAQEAFGSSVQFGQALQSNRLAGDELRSVMEGMPVEIIEALAKAAGTTYENLKKTSQEGKLTQEVLVKALKGAREQVELLFLRTIPTIGNAFTYLETRMIQFASKQSGVLSILSGSIMLLADNLHFVIPAIAAFGAAWLAVEIARVIAGIHGIILNLIAFAPVILSAAVFVGGFAIGVIAAITALYGLGSIIAALLGKLPEFDQLVNDMTQTLVDFANNIGGAIFTEATTTFDQITQSAAKSVGAITGATVSTDQLSASMNDAKANSDSLTTGLDRTGAAGQSAFNNINESLQTVNNTMANLLFKLKQAEAQAHATAAAFKEVPGFFGNPLGSPNSSFIVQKPGEFLGGDSFVNSKVATPSVGRGTTGFRAGQSEVLAGRPQRASGGGSQVVNNNVTIEVYTPDADSFRRSRRQVANDYRMGVA